MSKLEVEEFADMQADAVRFLHDIMVNGSSDSDEVLKARVISAQTVLGSEPPVDTEAFIGRVRESLHAELEAAGIDVEGALAEKKVVVH